MVDIANFPDFIHNNLVNAPEEESAQIIHQAALDIFNAYGWVHKAAKLSVEPGITTLEDFKRKFPGQLSDKDLPIGKFQKESPMNYFYTKNTGRAEVRRQLQSIQSSNDTRSTLFRENLSSYHFIDTQV